MLYYVHRYIEVQYHFRMENIITFDYIEMLFPQVRHFIAKVVGIVFY